MRRLNVKRSYSQWINNEQWTIYITATFLFLAAFNFGWMIICIPLQLPAQVSGLAALWGEKFQGSLIVLPMLDATWQADKSVSARRAAALPAMWAESLVLARELRQRIIMQAMRFLSANKRTIGFFQYLWQLFPVHQLPRVITALIQLMRSSPALLSRRADEFRQPVAF